MRFLTILTAMAWLAGAALGETPPAAKKAAGPKATAKSTLKSAPAKTAAKGPPVRHTASKSKKTVVVRRPVQQQPTADRYQEIQQALADKGYFRGPVDGTWGPESTEALKRFQHDQNLDSDGKIGALSLMALGLGPKRGTASAQAIKSSAEPVDSPPVAQPQP